MGSIFKQKIKQMVSIANGVDAAHNYGSFKLEEKHLHDLKEAVNKTLSITPPDRARCIPLSCLLATYLIDNHHIPALAIAGDLFCEKYSLFSPCKKLPPRVNSVWSGHCWVIVDDVIIDLSIFRTAYSMDDDNLFKMFMIKHFGTGRGAFMSPPNGIPPGLKYKPKFIFPDDLLDFHATCHGMFQN
jgi:hypothetical protein